MPGNTSAQRQNLFPGTAKQHQELLQLLKTIPTKALGVMILCAPQASCVRSMILTTPSLFSVHYILQCEIPSAS